MKKIKGLYNRCIDKILYRYNYKKLSKYMTSQGRKTSMSDDNIYPALCYAASENEDFFRYFRRNYIYNKILEHVPKSMGQDYLDIIEKKSRVKFSDSDWDNFTKNDLYGKPKSYSYIINERTRVVSPTTLRYVKVLQDIITLFDVEKIKNIAEIGVGYAGECRILTSYFSISKYSLFDLPEVLGLSRRYLNMFGNMDKISFVDGTKIMVEDDYDFVISNYAFSELVRDVQNIYLDKVILKSKAGYITWNSLSYDVLDGYSLDELLKLIPGSSVIAEEPLTAPNNCIIIWGNK